LKDDEQTSTNLKNKMSRFYVDLDGDYDPEDPKKKPSVDTVVQNVKSYANTSYGCTFFPWVLIKDIILSTINFALPIVAIIYGIKIEHPDTGPIGIFSSWV
jgi:hypothetical protein